jgi:hypothetical protein
MLGSRGDGSTATRKPYQISAPAPPSPARTTAFNVLLLGGGVSAGGAGSGGSGGGALRAWEGGGGLGISADAAASGGNGGGPFRAREEGGGGREADGDGGLGLGKFDADGGWLLRPTAGTSGVVDDGGGGGRETTGDAATGDEDGRAAADHCGGVDDAETDGGRD